MKEYKVDLSLVREKLKRIPKHISLKLIGWARDIEIYGLKKVRLSKGYHDEPLKGKRKGQRSIRLSKGYRAIYIEKNDDQLVIIETLEVHKHDY